MKKKILMKHILAALTMAAMVPISQAWAAEIDLGNGGNNQINLVTGGYGSGESSAGNLNDFTDRVITITKTPEASSQRDFAIVIPQSGTGIPYGNVTWNKDFYVTVTNSEGAENADGLHIMGVAGENAAVAIGDFSGQIQAANSDGISIVNEAQGSNKLIVGSIGQNGGLTVDHGNGIRASAVVVAKGATEETPLSVVQVKGATNITINGEKITAEKQFTHDDISSLPGDITRIDISGGYSPAAVYAGDDMYNITSDSISSDLIQQMGVPDDLKGTAQGMFKDMFGNVTAGNESKGQGEITLKGDTNLLITKSTGVDSANQGGYGLYAGKNGHIRVDGNLRIQSEADNSYGIAARNANLIYGDTFDTTVSANEEYIDNIKSKLYTLSFTAGFFGIKIDTDCIKFDETSFTANLTNLDASPNHGTSVTLGEGKDVSISMQGDNSYAMYAEGVDDDGEQVSISGNINSLYAEGDMLVENGGLIDLTTKGTVGEGNSFGAYQLGAVIASGTNKNEKSTYSLSSTNANYISSKSVIDHAGDLDTSTDNQFNGKSVISALYAEDGADIKISSAQSNTFLTAANFDNEKQLERVIWAYNGADINIKGTTLISTDSYEKSANSNDIAIAAGTAVGIDENTDFNTPVVDRAEVKLNYGAGSSVTGDIIAGYAGEVNISRALDAGDAGIQVEGNLLAGNNGILNVDLGNGGTLTGRADDYGDAGVIEGSQHTTFFDPAFSSDIYKGGAVNLTMGAGSTWNVTGQSWITSITTADSGSTPVIDLVSANTDRNTTAHALTVYNMDGNAVFNMSLDGDRDVSDMLYMKTANGSYIINVIDPVSADDMIHDETNTDIEFGGLRFATVGAGSKVSFRAVTLGAGMQNIEYTVGSEEYNSAKTDENNAYNSADGVVEGSSEKPGTDMVEGFFDRNGKPPTDSGNSGEESQIMLLDTASGNAEDKSISNTTNFQLVNIKNTTLSNAGQTVIALSKVNYSNAVYMDRLNKRVGEARYLDGDDGLWVRIRHDRTGKDNAFRSMNTMMELGYDWKAEGQKNGEHRQGVVFDYMRGTADYTNVMGDGDVRRTGVWLYDTWLGDKGHYTDYVVKYGRLSNDFNILNELGTEVSGDYDNDVWSVSAEYGRKKDIGNDWYFEPQAQLQYAYVTSADYTTSQGTKVELDGIDSLIGRAGFRLGRDTSEGNTVYFKADILHEFLGDQSIRAVDKTGVLSTTYENEGTWYDVGFGFSHRMGKDSYMFLDLEHSFGNDNDETYQINIGLSKAF